jgi:NTE family protein
MTQHNGNASSSKVKSLNLALQGGGALGAFTWGVLDRLLEDERIEIEAVSGTSAGAMNGVVLVDGLMRGGRKEARAQLRKFWHAVSTAASCSPIQRGPFDIFTGNWSLDLSPAYFFIDTLTQAVSPYQFNPFNINPLRHILIQVVDFKNVQACDHVKLFVSATNVETGRVRVFGGRNLTIEKVMASACMPTLFHSVKIDGQHYWDGGYMGNPLLFPFYSRTKSDDILIVQINPIAHKGLPRTAYAISDRINEISFNSSLLAELRALDFVRRMLAEGWLDSKRYRAMNVHIIDGASRFGDLGVSAKFNAERSFLDYLFGVGWSAAGDWLEANFDRIGHESTVDVRALFQGDGYDMEESCVREQRQPVHTEPAISG